MKKSIKNRWALSLTLIAATGVGTLLVCPQTARADFLLQPNDRVVFYGDSITEFRNYTRPFQDYVYARYPELKIRFFNAGWSGDKADNGLARLNRDVMPLQPDLVTLCFGMNDGRYTRLDDAMLANYTAKMDGIVKALTDQKIRVVVFSPPPVDYDRQPGWVAKNQLIDVDYNKTLEAFGEADRAIAAKYGATYVDILHPILDGMANYKVKNPGASLIPDAVHPDENGGIMMGGAMLLGLGAEPMPPLADVSATQLTGADKNQITPQKPVAVPLWMSETGAQAARAVGFLKVAGQNLRVRDLKAGTYDVKINGKSLGMWSDKELGAGVLVPGTYSEQAHKLWDVTNWKEGNNYNWWRNLQLGPAQGPAVEGAVAALKRADENYQQAIDSLSAPVEGVLIEVKATGLPADAGPNLALGKPYVASDPNVYDYGTGGLTDGSWNGEQPHTFATGETDVFPKNATIDLGAVTPVKYVWLGVPGFGSTKTVEVSLSRDGQNFTKVGSTVFNQNTEARHLYSFAATPARYVRLTYPDHYPNESGYHVQFAFTSEVEVFGGK